MKKLLARSPSVQNSNSNTTEFDLQQLLSYTTEFELQQLLLEAMSSEDDEVTEDNKVTLDQVKETLKTDPRQALIDFFEFNELDISRNFGFYCTTHISETLAQKLCRLFIGQREQTISFNTEPYLPGILDFLGVSSDPVQAAQCGIVFLKVYENEFLNDPELIVAQAALFEAHLAKGWKPTPLESIIIAAAFISDLEAFAASKSLMDKLNAHPPEDISFAANRLKQLYELGYPELAGKLAATIPWNSKKLLLNETLSLIQLKLQLNLINPEIGPKEILADMKQWGHLALREIYQQIAQKSETLPVFDFSPLLKLPKLHIGYLSSQFQSGPIANFLPHILACHHQSKAVNVSCFYIGDAPDNITDAFKTIGLPFHDLCDKNPVEAARFIYEQKVHVLVDLDGLFGNNENFSILACKPAPVQVEYAGWPATLGFPTVTHRITSARIDSPNDQIFYTETLHYLNGPLLVFKPCETGSPEPVRQSPVCKNGYITFAVTNRLLKYSETDIKTWSTILKQVPGAKLILKGYAFEMEWYKKELLQRFEVYGISPDRLIFYNNKPYAEYMAIYNEADIFFEMKRYNGTNTTCEALYMGVPAIVHHNDQDPHVAKVSQHFIRILGDDKLNDALIAKSSEDFIQKAVALASDISGLSKLRETLADRVRTSAICSGEEKLTKELEVLYISMWETEKTRPINQNAVKNPGRPEQKTLGKRKTTEEA